MAYTTHTPRPANPALPALPTISLRASLPWLIFAVLLAALGVYFIGAEQGATAILSGNAVHEWVHDGRHLLGFPCH